MIMIQIKGLSIKLGKFELQDIDFSVSKGEYFVLLGLSGAGKSVLLQAIAGLIRSAGGSVLINGRDLTFEKIQKRNTGLVFQESALFPHMTVSNNIAYPLRSRKMDRRMVAKRVEELAGIVSADHLLKRYPSRLSGGEKQRVALARALAFEPDVLLLDEPLSSLDVQLRADMRSLLRKINRQGQTIIHVTHDYEEAALLADRIGVIENGSVVQTGTPAEVFQYPKSRFIARFVGIRNFFSGKLMGGAGTLRKFSTDGPEFTLLSDEDPGEGYVVIRAEDVILSETRQSSSAVNNFRGVLREIIPAAMGTEIIADIGLPLGVLVSDDSVDGLNLKPGNEIWLSFKASAIKYIAK
jgi:ABC-type sugar transport system ATPase subunit